ncbi:MAG: GSCFA domain-containing protein [Mediterranea sp.]|jgi:hypothetical protein|nr:GSCFA domain-containing protein [Mediterranea sp.]
MEFRTRVDTPKNVPGIAHGDELLLMGSCFSEHIGNMLIDAKFRCDVNPLGIVYNPRSMRIALEHIREKKLYTEADLFFHNGCHRSYMHHGSFAGNSAEKTLDTINTRIDRAHRSLPRISHMLLTFGTAWVFRLKESGQVVSNCHKMPANLFEHTRLTVEEIIEDYAGLIREMQKINPTCRFLFTVSPVRHTKDGAHGNQLSKAVLLLAIEGLQKMFPQQALYFPAYEIVQDELRDYRFYDQDMNHPSPVAVNYVWERFAECFFPPGTQTIVDQCLKIKKDLLHRPFGNNTEAGKDFLKQIILRINAVEKNHPNLDFKKEKEQCHTQLNMWQN